jgi:hypothetical protein
VATAVGRGLILRKGSRAAPVSAEVKGTKIDGSRSTMLTAKARHFSKKVRTARAVWLAANLAPIIKELQQSGVTSLRAIASVLDQRGFETPRGQGSWQATQVRRVLARLRPDS